MDTGALHNVELGFEGIKMILKQGKKKQDRIILDGSIKGKARPGRMVRHLPYHHHMFYFYLMPLLFANTLFKYISLLSWDLRVVVNQHLFMHWLV